MTRHDDYAICLLAGGQARRMGGGDKGEITFQGKSLISHLIERFGRAPYMFVNANGDLTRFAKYQLDVIPDKLPHHQGPLSGIYAAMCHLQLVRPDLPWLLTVPTDAPLLPPSLPDDLRKAASQTGADIVSVTSKGRTHPVIGLWSLSLLDALRHDLIDEGVRKIDQFSARHECHYLAYMGEDDPFINLNRPEDLAAFQARFADN